ncbi:arylsulfatase [Flammeovirga sp. SJP92]|uniref:arylsulfatase n=1 Tax=Flammeovirga sp. SJP92 TaxID=1775430 RepID=UPI0007874051|nr:arylsulfatase [Flammeovirga sp. SJP92]KXX70550.1 arylsulfatase [Flammeovirga sp. SJP92]
MKKNYLATLLLFVLTFSSVFAQDNKKPNILVIWGDDTGWFSLSAYHRGIMGAQTPNIDRIGNEGIIFTDFYGDQSCTAGRSSFVTGQHPTRTGLSKVGLPGAPQGISELDPTIASALKKQGYATGQFGKNHLGDRDEHLPTNHGFDEFFGNLYHLNAEEEPESPFYPQGEEFAERFMPRGVIHSYADGRISDTGPLTKKRMETADEEFIGASKRFMKEAVEKDEPFFVWLNTSRMHIWTRLKEESKKTGFVYHDGLVEHDEQIGSVLDYLEELGIDENTIVVYSTDNGAMKCTWPDAGASPFRGEKNTTWEGGVRVPMMIKWPAQIEAGQISNEMMSHLDWFPTLVAAAGNDNVTEELKKGTSMIDRDYKVHLDGYNFLPYMTGKTTEAPRKVHFYAADDGKITAIRKGDWKVHLSIKKEVEAKGFEIWRTPFTDLTAPLIVNLREDPFESAHMESGFYDGFYYDAAPVAYDLISELAKFKMTFKEFPKRMKAGSFTDF